MIAIMATTTVFFPLTGENSKLDIVWLYPSFLLGGDAEPVAAAPAPPPREEQALSPSMRELPQKAATPPQEPAEDAVETERAEPARQPSPPPPVAAPPKPEAVAAAPETAEPEPESETEPEMTLPPATPQQTAIKPETPAPASEIKKAEAKKEIVIPPPAPPVQTAKAEAKPVVKEPVKVTTPPRETPPPVKQEKAVAKEVIPPPVKTEAKAPEVTKPAPVPVSVTNQPREPVARTEIRRESMHDRTAKNVASEKPATTSSTDVKSALTPVQAPLKKESGPGPAIVQKKVEPLPVAKTVINDKPSENGSGKTGGAKGIMVPPLIGDLKLVITAPPEALKGIKITVRFWEYPKTRHNRPMTKGDARQVQTLTPVTAKQSENSLAAVIETSREGIYEFRNITETTSAATADFKVRIYESSPRAKLKSAGSRRISDKGSITKIMMPEGILWDDETAFSGSMEDSESITRFNSDTGLVWKEYRE